MYTGTHLPQVSYTNIREVIDINVTNMNVKEQICKANMKYSLC